VIGTYARTPILALYEVIMSFDDETNQRTGFAG